MKTRMNNVVKASPIGAHLRELKWRVFASLVCFFMFFAISAYYGSQIYAFLALPLKDLDSNITMIYTAMGEGFMVQIRVALYAAVFASIPFWLYQLYRFIAPGLRKTEKNVALPCFLLSPILFLLGASFLYYFVMPVLWKFFMSFQIQNADNSILLYAKISEYLSLCLSLALSFGLSFQLPVVVIILSKCGVVTTQGLRKKRKYAIVLIFMLAAVLTPPDVISQICLAIPLLLLYEISIILSKIFK